MANKFLAVGINTYPSAPLRGCINDIANASRLMVDKGVFEVRDVHLLTDERATAVTIKDRLRWLVGGAASGDKLLYWESGHGTLLPLRDKNGDMISNDACFCPYDFAWTEETAITTSAFAEMFANIPEGVEFVFVSDSCHADLARVVNCSLPGPDYRVARQYPMPADMAWRVETAKAQGIESPSLWRAMPEHLHGAFIGGCKRNQTSADAFIDGAYCGALSHYLLARLKKDGLSVPLTKVIERVNADLKIDDYDQEPQLRGQDDHIAHGFLQGGC
jgi:hypothetical protein